MQRRLRVTAGTAGLLDPLAIVTKTLAPTSQVEKRGQEGRQLSLLGLSRLVSMSGLLVCAARDSS
jgi:hypothetical protein